MLCWLNSSRAAPSLKTAHSDYAWLDLVQSLKFFIDGIDYYSRFPFRHPNLPPQTPPSGPSIHYPCLVLCSFITVYPSSSFLVFMYNEFHANINCMQPLTKHTHKYKHRQNKYKKKRKRAVCSPPLKFYNPLFSFYDSPFYPYCTLSVSRSFNIKQTFMRVVAHRLKSK